MALSPLTRALTTLAAEALLCTGLAPTGVAQTITPPATSQLAAASTESTTATWDDDGYVIADNQTELDKLIATARDAGVTVKTQTEKLTPVSDSEAVEAKANLEAKYTTAMATLNAAISAQEKNNEKYASDLKAELDKMFKQKKGSDLKDANLDWDSLSVITKAPNSAEHPFSLTMHPKEGTPEDQQDFNKRNYIDVGDSWTYSNVFQDAHSGSWVDMTLELIGAQEHFNRQTPSFKTVDRVNIVGGKLYANSVELWTANFDVNIKVTFTDNTTGNPIEITPLVIFTDVDEGQGVEITTPQSVKTMLGEKLRTGLAVDGVRGTSDSIFDTGSSASPGDPTNWAAYALTPTSTFSYWFYDGYTGDVLHGTGGSGLGFTRPAKEYETATVTLYQQPVEHSVTYQIEGDKPETSTDLPAVGSYSHNDPVTIADHPTTTSEEKVGVDGKWVFKGWFTDQALTSAATTFNITEDTTIYGGWEFTPNTYKVTHEFVSGTEGMELPEAVTGLTPGDQAGIVTGTTVKPGEFKTDPVKDPDHDGFWTFQSWDNESLVIDKGDAKFTGAWVYADTPKPVAPEEPKKNRLAKTGTAAGLLSGLALALLSTGALMVRRRESLAAPGPRHAAN